MSRDYNVTHFIRRNIGWFTILCGLGLQGLELVFGDKLLSNVIIQSIIGLSSVWLILIGIVILIQDWQTETEVGEFTPDPIQIEIELDKYTDIKADGVWWSSEEGYGPSMYAYHNGKFKPNDNSPDLYPASIFRDSTLKHDVLAFDDTGPEYIMFLIDITQNFSGLVLQEICRARTTGTGVVIRQLWYRIFRNKTNISSWSSEDEVISLQQIRMPNHDNYFEIETEIPIEKFVINGKPVKSGDELQIIYATNPLAIPQTESPFVGDWVLRSLRLIMKY